MSICLSRSLSASLPPLFCSLPSAVSFWSLTAKKTKMKRQAARVALVAAVGVAPMSAFLAHIAYNASRLDARLTCVAAILMWTLYVSRYSYWYVRGIRGPIPLPVFGTHLAEFFVPLQELEEQRYKKFGRVYGVFDGSKPALVVAHPEAVTAIMRKEDRTTFVDRRAVTTIHPVMSLFLSSLEGDHWRRVRRLVMHAFSDRNLRAIVPHMTAAAESVLLRLEQEEAEKKTKGKKNMNQTHLPASANASACDAHPEADFGGDPTKTKTPTAANPHTPTPAATLIPDTIEVDIKELTGEYTMRVIATAAFDAEPTPEFVRHASTLFTFSYWRKFVGDYTFPRWMLDLMGFTVLPKPAMDFFRSITERLIAERRAAGHRRDDCLQLLMDAEIDADLGSDAGSDSDDDCDGDNHGRHQPRQHRQHRRPRRLRNQRQRLTKDEILSQCVLFFSVGYETSSQLLLYALYLLTAHQNIQQRLYEEVLSTTLEANADGGSGCCGDDTDSEHVEVDHDRIRKLPYLAAVVNETLRLYNPVLRMERRASADFNLQLPTDQPQHHLSGTNGTDIADHTDNDSGSSSTSHSRSRARTSDIAKPPTSSPSTSASALASSSNPTAGSSVLVPEGMIVAIPVWALHHDPELYPDPSVFDPDRFLTGRKPQPSTYLPFGQGARNCIGERFALRESKQLLAELILKYRFVPSPRTAPPTFFTTGRPLLGPKSIYVGMQRRPIQVRVPTTPNPASPQPTAAASSNGKLL
eukprot:m.223841 g.223841  ORF g.223841 m.223841 type:complete len:751 (-) comp18760_c0_seq1:103-2355(-)